ncbi:MAG: hypothetical protein CMJ58_00720 [Planctomycetaceae bacterium]|nr:hypothetical protein [Planctomycetaceae bacterium]
MKCNLARLFVLTFGVLSLGGSATTHAAPTVYFERDDNSGFMTSYPNSQGLFDSFTASLSSFGVAPIDDAVGVDPALAFAGSGITATATGVLAQAAPGFQIGTQALLEIEAAGGGDADTVFTFDQYITAFGLYVIQGGDGANDNLTTFRLTNTAANSSVDVPVQIGPNWGQSNVFFLGLTDTDAFNQVQIIETLESDGMLYDNIVAGFAVPEPASLALAALCGIGLAARAAGRRRR